MCITTAKSWVCCIVRDMSRCLKIIHSCVVSLARTQRGLILIYTQFALDYPGGHSLVYSADEHPLVLVLYQRQCIIHCGETAQLVVQYHGTLYHLIQGQYNKSSII